MTTALRETMLSTGVHIGAVRRLGETYSTEEYLVAVERARDAGDGEAYANRVLGVDADELIRGVEQDDGNAIVLAAERSLRRRGVDPKKATYQEYADALAQVSS
jgi:hypothetical protein